MPLKSTFPFLFSSYSFFLALPLCCTHIIEKGIEQICQTTVVKLYPKQLKTKELFLHTSKQSLAGVVIL